MCGINGIFHLNFKQVDQNQLIKMRDILEHRGPDDSGIYINNNIGLGHRRLSIIDTSSAGHQPFFSDDGRYVIVFNGEIYNYQSFYPELKRLIIINFSVKYHYISSVIRKKGLMSG